MRHLAAESLLGCSLRQQFAYAATAHAAASTVVDVIVSRCQLHSNQPGKGTKGVVYYFEWSSKHYVIKVKTMFIGEHSLPRSIICMSNDSVTSI